MQQGARLNPTGLHTSPESHAAAAHKGPVGESTQLLANEAGAPDNQGYSALEFPGYFNHLHGRFGGRFLWVLFATQHVLKGFVQSFYSAATPYLYQYYHVPAPQVQVLNAITNLPWAMKPIIGIMSDSMPIRGYRKAPYMLATSAMGTAAMLCIGAFPLGAFSLRALAVALGLINLQLATNDLLSEAKYAEKLRESPVHGSALMTYVWFGLRLMSLLAILLAGAALEFMSSKELFLIAAFPSALAMLPVAAGFLEEPMVMVKEIELARKSLFAQREACVLSGLMFFGSMTILAAGMGGGGPSTSFFVSAGVGAGMLVAFSVALSPVIAGFNAFSMLSRAMSVSISGATFYFYTDTAVQYPAGPHFSPFFYNAVMGTVGAVCSLAGILVYHRFMSTWRFRTIVVMTSVVIAALSMLDVMMFARLNVKLGIPDEYLVIGLSVSQSMLAQFQWMPQVVLLSRLCPKGMEATMYALLAGSHNLGMTIADNTGAMLLEAVNCVPNGVKEDAVQMENLWIASLVSGLMPLLCVILFYRLIPDLASNEEALASEGAESATSGSLLRRWSS